MAYKFNGGAGAVICDTCKVMFDAYLSYESFLEIYRSDGNLDKEDICWKCKEKKDKKKKKKK